VSRTANSWPLESLVSHRLRSVPPFINESGSGAGVEAPSAESHQTPATGPPLVHFQTKTQRREKHRLIMKKKPGKLQRATSGADNDE